MADDWKKYPTSSSQLVPSLPLSSSSSSTGVSLLLWENLSVPPSASGTKDIDEDMEVILVSITSSCDLSLANWLMTCCLRTIRTNEIEWKRTWPSAIGRYLWFSRRAVSRLTDSRIWRCCLSRSSSCFSCLLDSRSSSLHIQKHKSLLNTSNMRGSWGEWLYHLSMVINLLGDQEVSVKYIRRGVKHRVGYFHANFLVTKWFMAFTSFLKCEIYFLGGVNIFTPVKYCSSKWSKVSWFGSHICVVTWIET